MKLIFEILRGDFFDIILKILLSVTIGAAIGSERARHERAAGVRTHILVSLGACLTSLISIFVSDAFGGSGDIFRIPAQVISGIGFLGAGMIIIKNNDIIIGLTTAAGVWTTGIIGIAVGYGFYTGAVIGTVVFLTSIIILSKFEKRKRITELFYVEIDDLYKLNQTVENIKNKLCTELTYKVIPPKSTFSGNLGLMITISKKVDFNIYELCEIENVVYVCEE